MLPSRLLLVEGVKDSGGANQNFLDNPNPVLGFLSLTLPKLEGHFVEALGTTRLSPLLNICFACYHQSR